MERGHSSDSFQLQVWAIGETHRYSVAGGDSTASDDQRHDASPSDQLADRCLLKQSGHQSLLEVIQLPAWVSPSSPTPAIRLIEALLGLENE